MPSPSASHRHSPSQPVNKTTYLIPPSRRMTMPAQPLNLPEPVGSVSPTSNHRPPSPLRVSHIPQSADRPHFIDPVDSDVESVEGEEDLQTPSPATSFVSNIAARVNTYLKPQPLTDAQLEANAAKERDRSRKEAEAILLREASDRRAVEERVLELMNKSGSPLHSPAKLSPATTPVDEGSKEKGWWAVTKSKLTPTKDLTPAQQIIEESRVREKEAKKKGKSRESLDHYQDQRHQSGYLSPRLAPPQPSGSAPSRQTSAAPSPAASPGQGQTQHDLYIVQTPSGALDVHTTLVNLARRFEKLERWSVAHVRALEERVKEVENWCVERERADGPDYVHANRSHGGRDKDQGDPRDVEIRALRVQMAELTARVSLLGTSIVNTSTPTQATVVSQTPPNVSRSSFVESLPASPTQSRIGTYPAGDYVSPPPTEPIRQGPFKTNRKQTSPHAGDTSNPEGDAIQPSPTGAQNSPPVSLTRGLSKSGLPVHGLASTLSLPSDQLGTSTERTDNVSPATSYSSWSSVESYTTNSQKGRGSPTPRSRKRYTVALGAPITSEPRTFSSQPPEEDEEEQEGGITIGRSEGRKVGSTGNTTDDGRESGKRLRAQSQAELTMSAPVSPSPASRNRTPSTSTSGSRSESVTGGVFSGGRFVDPLEARRRSRQEAEREARKVPGKNVPVGQLVAFFDGDR